MENDVKDNVISLEQILTSLLSRLSDIVYTNTVACRIFIHDKGFCVKMRLS